MSIALGLYGEQLFIAECIKRNIFLNRPIIDSKGYDFLIDTPSKFTKVQVKSVYNKMPSRNSYKVNLNKGCDNKKEYTSNCFDVLVIYVAPENYWLIIPYNKLETNYIRISNNTLNRYLNEYVNNWSILSGD